MNNYYSYQESLDIVEKFMIDSGIREYCESICKGKCCIGCYDSSNACFKNEGRRLACSTRTKNKHFDTEEELRSGNRNIV